MAEINPPLYLDQDDAYGAADLGLPFRDIMGEGVVGTNDLLVTAGTGLNSSVASGAAWIAGDDDANAQPTYRVRSDAAVTLAHNAADATNPRIDLVIAEVLDATFSGVSKLWRLRVVTGTPAASPSAPALPSNAIKLAEVRINAGSGSITSVTDKRTNAVVGGGKAAPNSSAGKELAYAEITAAVNIAGNTEGTATLIVAAPSVVYDGGPVMVEFFSDYVSGGSNGCTLILRDDTAGVSLGWIAQNDANRGRAMTLKRRITPAAGARVYSIRGFTSGGVPGIAAGVGGAGNVVPAFIRITKV